MSWVSWASVESWAKAVDKAEGDAVVANAELVFSAKGLEAHEDS